MKPKCDLCRDTGWMISRTKLAPDPVARGEHVLVAGPLTVVPCMMHAPHCRYGDYTPCLASHPAYAECGKPRPPKPGVADLRALGL